jgi:hypothetical protein
LCYIGIRPSFWEVDAERQAWAMYHEFARYVHFMKDRRYLGDPNGVETWDQVVEWLASRLGRQQAGATAAA